MYAVYCRLNGHYERVGAFKTLGEASARAETLRRHPLAGPQCMYYVTGPGLPTPEGLAIPPERPAAHAPAEQPVPKRGLVDRIADHFRRPKEKTNATPQRSATAEPKHDRSRGPSVIPGKPSDVWYDRAPDAKSDAPLEPAARHVDSPEVRSALQHAPASGARNDPDPPSAIRATDSRNPSRELASHTPIGEEGERSGDSAHYAVMRRLGSQVSVAKGHINSLVEARYMAAHFRQSDADKQAQYFVQAPPRRRIVRSQATEIEGNAAFAAGNGVVGLPHSQSSTSANSRPRHSQPSSTRMPPQPERRATPARQQPSVPEPPQGTRYYVVRVGAKGRFPVKGGFRSLDDACQYALALQKQTSDVGVTYEVEYHGPAVPAAPKAAQPKPQRPAPKVGPQRKRRSSSPRRANPRPPWPRHDWEVEDRHGDLSLLDRTEEELGLGIPAQWGKGRRNRKGWYIP